MKCRNASPASFCGTKDWPLCEHIAVSWVWHFQMLTAWFLNLFLHSALRTSWTFALNQRVSAKGSSFTEGEYGKAAKRGQDLWKVCWFSLSVLHCKIQKQRTAKHTSQYCFMGTNTFVLENSYSSSVSVNKGELQNLEFFLASEFAIPFIFSPML